MRHAFRRYASGVMVLTHRDPDGRAYGMTATSVCSVSVKPPTLLACVNRSARSHRQIVQGRRFAITMLSDGQRYISEYCAAPGAVKQLPASWIDEREDRVPVIQGGLGSIQCRLAKKYGIGTHSILIGSVVGVELGSPGKPLLYFEGTYRSMKEVGEELAWSDPVGIIW